MCRNIAGGNWQFLKKLNTVTMWSNNCTPRSRSERIENIHTKNCTWTRTSLLIIAKHGNNPNVPSLNKWIKCGISIQGNIDQLEGQILLPAPWMSLGKVLSERSQTPKATYSMMLFIGSVQNRQSIETKSRLVVSGRVNAKGYRISMSDEMVLKLV